MIKKQGSVLLFSLMILSALVLLCQQLIQNIYVGSRFDVTMINREKAEIVALSGINVAIALLQEPFMPQKKGETSEKESAAKKQATSLLPLLNQWRTFDLDYDLDGMEGTLSLCIISEDGKIPLAQIYDLKSNTIKAPFDTLLKKIPFDTKKKKTELSNLQQKESKQSITDALITYFKKRKRPLDDISELYALDQFQSMPLWHSPLFPHAAEDKKKKEVKALPIALSDIFSLYSREPKIHPLLLSHGVRQLLQVAKAEEAVSFEKRKELLKPLLEKYQDTWSQDWVAHWKQLQPLHPLTPKDLAFFKDIFASTFEPTTFSVLSSGVVQGVEQRICALITKDTEYTTTQKEVELLKKPDTKEQQLKKAQKRPYKVLKLYWI